MVHVDDQRIVYAGGVSPVGIGVGGPADVRTCDTLIVSARYGHPRFRFPPPDQVLSELCVFCQTVTERGGTAVLLVENEGAGIDLVHLLAGQLRVDAHRSIHRASARLKAQATLPAVRRFSAGAPRGGRVLLWPLRFRNKLDMLVPSSSSEVALVSGSALESEALARAKAARGFVLSGQADFEGLRHYIDSSRAEQVFLTHAIDEGSALRDALKGRSVEPIGPPQQMSLF